MVNQVSNGDERWEKMVESLWDVCDDYNIHVLLCYDCGLDKLLFSV